MLSHLAKFVNENEEILEAWVNKKGEWVFSENHQFPIHMTRKQILEHLSDEDEEDVTVEELEQENTELAKQLAAMKAENDKLKAAAAAAAKK